MSLSNVAIPKYYGEFRQRVINGEIPVLNYGRSNYLAGTISSKEVYIYLPMTDMVDIMPKEE